jgi:putative heme-binding domain-containing protein
VDGRTVTGSIISENAQEVTIGLANGKRTEVSLQEIEERVESKISAMPEMLKVLSTYEIRDVVAYLAIRKEGL